MAEIKREIVNETPFKTKCIKCGKEITLWWNGGELDQHDCCGYTYSLEHGDIHFVIEDNGINK